MLVAKIGYDSELTSGRERECAKGRKRGGGRRTDYVRTEEKSEMKFSAKIGGHRLKEH